MAIKEHTATGTHAALTHIFDQPADPGIASAEDYAACRAVMHGASKNYSFASRFLPADRQPHVEALYAFLRIGDDRVDVSHQGFASAEEAIDDWEWRYNHAFETGDSDHPVMRAYLNTALALDIPRETMNAYFRSMREDLVVKRFPTFAALLHYIDGSAIPVGRAMTCIMGVVSPYCRQDALPAADALATAMQLSNFWRDVGQDWQRDGRIYLPEEDMARFGYSEADLAAGRVNEALVNLLEYEFARTETYYQQARDGVPLLARGRWGVLAGLEIYRAILFSIRRGGYDVFSQRAGANRWRKAGLVLKAWWGVTAAQPLS